jgi:hypothetical protein
MRKHRYEVDQVSTNRLGDEYIETSHVYNRRDALNYAKTCVARGFSRCEVRYIADWRGVQIIFTDQK